MRIIPDENIAPTMEISYPRTGGSRSEYWLCQESNTIEITDAEWDEIFWWYEEHEIEPPSQYLRKLIELKRMK
jgi:hypothetical protein